MTKNIQIVPFGGLTSNKYPHLFLNGVKNIVRNLEGLNYEIEIKEKNGVIEDKIDKKNKIRFEFTIPYDEFRESKITHDIEYSFLVYDTYPDFSSTYAVFGKHFNGYITKLKKNNFNSYEIEIQRTTKIYNVEILDKKWLDLVDKQNKQLAFENIEKTFLLAKRINLNTQETVINDNSVEFSGKLEKAGLLNDYMIKVKPGINELLYINLHNTSSNQSNLISFTNLKEHEKNSSNYINLIKQNLIKNVEEWSSVVFYNNKEVKGLFIYNNQFVETILADILKSFNSSENTYLDLYTYNKDKTEFRYLKFKEVEIC